MIDYSNWYYGFAWTGGTGDWGGGSPGWKQATIDFGVPTTFSRAMVWIHTQGNVPIYWNIQYSDDDATWTNAYVNTVPTDRTATLEMNSGSFFPAFCLDASFAPVTARYFRYTFNDTQLFNGIHGWADEIEVFPPANWP
jgi:hypothetical protein